MKHVVGVYIVSAHIVTNDKVTKLKRLIGEFVSKTKKETEHNNRAWGRRSRRNSIIERWGKTDSARHAESLVYPREFLEHTA